MRHKLRTRLLQPGSTGFTPRVRTLAAWLVAVWLALVAFAGLLAPPLAKSFLSEQLTRVLGREVSIDKVSISPLSLSTRIDGLSVKDRAGGEQMGFGQLDVNFSALSIAQAAIVIDGIRLQSPRIAVTHLGDGRFDVSDLLDSWLTDSGKSTSSLPRFSLNNIQISGGQFVLDDRPKGVRHTAESVNFSLPFISSLPGKMDMFVQPAFSAVVDGAKVTLRGQAKPFAASHASSLELQLQDLDLSGLQPYMPASVPVHLKAGQLAVALKVDLPRNADASPTIGLSGTAQLSGLALTEASGAPWLTLDRLELALDTTDPLRGLWQIGQLGLEGLITGQSKAGAPLKIDQLQVRQARLDLTRRRVDAEAVQATGAHARLVRSPQGQLTWIDWPQAASSASRLSNASADGTAWVARVGRLALEASSLRFEDRSISPAAVQDIGPLSLGVENLDSSPGHPNAFTLAAAVNGSGALQARGTLQLQPLALQLQLDARALPVSPLQGYLSPYLNATMVQGLLSGAGALDIRQPHGAIAAGYKGSLTLGQFSAADPAGNPDFLRWKSLYIGGIDFQSAPARLNIGETALSDFYARLILSPQGRLNLADIIRTPASPEQPGAGSTPPMPIQIAKVTLQNGQVSFSDRFVRPNYTANITRLGGRVENLSSAADSVADLDLRGSYAGNAPVHISARLNPLAHKKFLDLQAEVSSVDLVDFSPYSGKYAGYKIDKGKLSLNASYKLQDRQLTAENRVFIDQLTFGEKVESPDATQLPVHLAIALLKNNRGEMDLHLPISGSLDDPQFSIGGLIFKAIANLFVKAITAPFAVLGSIFGHGEELSNITFAPGRSSLEPAALQKLEVLAKAMRERESLKLEITGSADRASDEEGLQRAALEQAMQAEKRKDLSGRTRESLSEQDLKITDSEYATYLKRSWQQARFPKPRNLIGLPKDLPLQEMEKLMLTNQSVTEDELRALATARAQAAQNWLVEQGQVPPGRIFLLPVRTATASGGSPDAGGSRVGFSLR
jgi:uncharacterized protein involved in outer membrane biogenesis